jgi:hypothetical protein
MAIAKLKAEFLWLFIVNAIEINSFQIPQTETMGGRVVPILD